MLGALLDRAPALLQLQDAALLQALQAELSGDWRAELASLCAGDWHAQLVAATALALAGEATADDCARLWQAIDGASWVAPQLVACALLVDGDFVARAEARLLDPARRSPKTVGALVRAYHRLPAPRLPVVAQLGRHDAVLGSEEARVGIRGVDAWLDRLPAVAPAAARARWRRQPR